MTFFETPNLRVEKQSEESAILLLDVAERSVNVFNRQVFADLDAAFDCLATLRSLKFLGIRSADPGKPIAGADLQEFQAIKDSDEARAVSALGQRVFQRLASLPIPTVLVIQGSCLGGGLEFALACDYRLVLDHPKTQLGFPEIELGLIPGWGGTQRLPRRVGLERALQMILTGRRLNARQALRWGLVDAIAADKDGLARELRRLFQQALRRGKRPLTKLPRRTWRQRLLESNLLGRAVLLRGTERALRQRVPDDMPAPQEALKAIRIGLRKGMEAGMALEQEAVGRLAMTTACRNLVHLFFQREAARKEPEHAPDAGTLVQRVGIVGAGMMGAGIAQLAALRGFDVVVQDVNESALDAGMNKIGTLFDKAVERGLIAKDEARQKLSTIGRTTAWEGFDSVDLVVEAVVEDRSLKQTVFRELERRTRPTTVLATNTSSLQVRHFQEALQHRQRVAGLHFFNPVHKMPLVEVVHGPETADSTIARCLHWAAALGKTPVVVKDSPGFVVNRILMPYLDEAVRLAAEGMPFDRIDEAMRRFGMPLGPLELLDQVGLDVAAHIAKSMECLFVRRFTPNPAFAGMTERDWLGEKSGTGFYHYQGRRKKPNSVARDILAEVSKSSGHELTASLPVAVQVREARERMVLLLVNEAAACLDEGLAANADTIDLAMVLGAGWAPHRGGPLRYLSDRGPGEVLKTLEQLAQRHGPRFEPYAGLRQQAKQVEPATERA